MSFYNLNFVNTYSATSSFVAIAMDIRAQQAAFYSCNFRSTQGTLLVNYGAFYFEHCVVEGTSDFVWGYGAAYFYNTVIIADSLTPGSAITAQIYQAQYGNSSIVYDHCTFLPANSSIPKGSYYLGRDYNINSRVTITNSFLDAHIMSAGWLIATTPSNVAFSEFNSSGPGASCNRTVGMKFLGSVAGYTAVDVLGSTDWLDSKNIAPFIGFQASPYGTLNGTISICPASPTSSSSSTSSSATTTSAPVSISSSTGVISATSVSGTVSSSASATSACATSTATFVVSTTPNSCQYPNVTAAIAALPNDGLPKTILIRAGVYLEQISITRNGKVTMIGDTEFPNDFTQNTVTIEISNGQLTSAGKDEITPVVHVIKSDNTGVSFYNINFINTYPQTYNTAALANDFYGNSIAAYGCSFIGFQDTFLANKGIQVISNSYIEGSVDFVWVS